MDRYDIRYHNEQEVQERYKATSLNWVKVKQFFGPPKKNDFKLVREELRMIKKGEILIESLCWTVDHYMTLFDVPVGSVMIGEQVASIIDSLNDDYPLYMLVVCNAGWRTHSIVNPEQQQVRRLSDIGNLPASLYLGALGLPG
ncbi:Prostaglandin reductase 1 [Bulinus truncatus]|nr:Prostaglandin reductase 1 [Bulinus truncatus]